MCRRGRAPRHPEQSAGLSCAQMYKEMAYKDAEEKAARDARKNVESQERARSEASAFEAKMYAHARVMLVLTVYAFRLEVTC